MSINKEIRSLRSLVDSIEDSLKENEENNSRLNYLATHDSLTELRNRYSFNEEVKDFFESSFDPQSVSLALYMIDLTRFKEINDTLGHAKGDLLLKFIARTLRKQVDESSRIYRLGGDEFAVLLKIDESKTEHSVGQLLNSLVEVFTRKYRLDENRVVVGASIGICVAPRDAANSEELIKRADIAMYRAKKSGNHTAYRYFDRTLEIELESRKEFENHVLEMIDSKKVCVHFQPKVDVGTEKIAGFEALIRHKDAVGNPLSSLQIIRIAEECNLIWSLGELIIRKSFEFIKLSKNKLGYCAPVSINISSLQIARSEFLQSFENLVEEYNIEYTDIGLEITESTLIDKPVIVKNTLLKLYEKGVKISIDDFGTGYSSLSYLHNYPFNELKVDQCFVKSMDTDEKKRNIVSGIIQLAHAIQLSVVAEGVESQAELVLLRDMGCDTVQGHYYHSAMSAEDALVLQRDDEAADTAQELSEVGDVLSL